MVKFIGLEVIVRGYFFNEMANPKASRHVEYLYYNLPSLTFRLTFGRLFMLPKWSLVIYRQDGPAVDHPLSIAEWSAQT